jgi:uncharacterized repeat protein (TIGR03803 family)
MGSTWLVMAALLALMPAERATAQIFKTLHSFTAERPNGANNDGAAPRAGLVVSGNILYGTAVYGGTSGFGTVFAINRDGTGFRTIYNFTGGADGANPRAGLLLLSNTLYGTASAGGTYNFGTVFALKTDGSSYAPLYSFTDANDGGTPRGGLVLVSNTLYGMTQFGGGAGMGTLFAINPDGSGFSTLYSFTGGTDGAEPFSELICSSNVLYGTTYGVLNVDNGTVFAFDALANVFTLLHGFAGAPDDGANPQAGLVLADNTLFGTSGGGSGLGTVFTLNTDGTGFSILHDFEGIADGNNPVGSLILLGHALYGTTDLGGTWGKGTVFKLDTDGTGFAVLHSFTGTNEGYQSFAGLILSSKTLYGTTVAGGTSGNGTIFSLTLPSPPSLTIRAEGSNAILTWPTNSVGFTLQSATNLDGTGMWSPVAAVPVVIKGENTVTNSVSGSPQFYRLIW